MFEERTFSLKGEQVEMNARWRFIEFPKPITIHQDNAFNVEFLSIEFTFGGRPERCWYWFHEGQLEFLQWLYNCAKENTPASEVFSWMSGLSNYPTTKSERKEALKMMVEFNNTIIQTAQDINVLPMWGTE